ncbi:MAG: MBL fold metallo-hydrolase [candidate division Zixibacteria bacterium]|nr:MBL fold metallo-hydrolase [candidate division Zixibacteria bacterium]
MINLAKQIQETTVKPGEVAIFWLAQAGFVYKNANGKILYVDPYLTDYVQRALPEYGMGFKRIMPKLIEPKEVDADYVISTHSHQDHLDVDALPGMLLNPRIHFIGAPDCEALYKDAGVPEDRYTIIHEGETLQLDEIRLTGIYADHGELAPDALGILLEIDGIRIWQVADSAYRPEQWASLFDLGIDILIPPINGAFGNLDGVEAAKLARDVKAKIVIPCHFWMFPIHYGDPAKFLEACQEITPDSKPLIMTQGEVFVYSK